MKYYKLIKLQEISTSRFGLLNVYYTIVKSISKFLLALCLQIKNKK